jgi:hypothetical protein
VTPHGNGLTALWREPFDHLTRYPIHDFRSFSRLCGGPYRPLSFDKLVRPYEPPAFDANLKGAKGTIAAQYPSSNFSRFINKVYDRPWHSALGRRRAMPRGAWLAYPCRQQTRNVLAPARLFDEFVDGLRLRAFEQSFKPRDFYRVVGSKISCHKIAEHSGMVMLWLIFASR